MSARTVSATEQVDKVRALQRVLYRSAKQEPHRRFHALYDKVARSDILWRAWAEVAYNQGAPGVDGVTIASIIDGAGGGVRAFLEQLAEQLRDEDVSSAAVAAGAHPEAGQAGPDPAARDPVCGRSRRDDGGQDRPRTDLRGRFLSGQFRVPPEAVRSPGAGSDPGERQPGSGLGARRRHQGVLRRDRSRRPHRSSRAAGVGPADVEAAAKLVAGRGVRGWDRLRCGGGNPARLTDLPAAGQHRPQRLG